MSQYQYQIYRIFEKSEIDIQKKARRYGKSSQLYKTYTRQACNFVFPHVNINVTGELRPRQNKFRLTENTIDLLEKGKLSDTATMKEKDQIDQYLHVIDTFRIDTEKYFQKINEEDVKNGRTILDDLAEFKKGFETVFDR